MVAVDGASGGWQHAAVVTTRWRWCLLLALAGCSWRSGYDAPPLLCVSAASDCPDGYTCSADGVCLAPDEPDARAVDPDAPPGQELSLTFGERPDSDVGGVTFDTYLSSGNPDDNKGAKDAFYASTADTRHALLRFDLSSIPPDATILAASLSLWTNDYATGGAVRVYQMREEWDEGDQDDAPGFSNWYFRRPLTFWSGAGATPPSSDTEPVAELAPDATFSESTTPLPASLVQAWVSTPVTNFGVTFVAVELDGDFGFHSREASPTSRRPQLTVSFVP
jgi:hypothetical protein